MLKNDYVQAALIALVLTALSFGIGVGFGWVTTINWLEIFAVLTQYACTFLCVRQRRLNYPVGAASTIAFAVLFFQSGLLGSMFVNALLSIQLIFGFIWWQRDSNPRPVEHVQAKKVPLYILATLAMVGGAYLILSTVGATIVIADLGIMALSVLAQWLLDRKKIETWYVWAAVNVLAIYVYFTNGLFFVGVQFIFLLGNTIYGYISWKDTMGNSMIVNPAKVEVVPNA